LASFGIYIHFPFCRKRCPFCDFAVAVRPEIPHEAYERAVLTELAARAPLFPGRRTVSIYFGGGTPGLWRADCVGRVIEACTAQFGSPQEVTVECIPAELTGQHARDLHAAGVSRLSIGIEALDDESLRALGREHTAADARRAIDDARAAGFENLSADLMFARPNQSLADWQRELDQMLAFDLPHLSLYQLTIEPGTAFAKLGVRVPDSADYLLAAHDRLTDYVHYEISSYAKPGHFAVHNSLYWTGGEYLGLGMSAHSFRPPQRFGNTRELDAYLRDPAAEPVQRETLDAAALAREARWLGLRRLDQGIPYEPALDDLIRNGLLEHRNGRVVLSRRGMLLADEVAVRLL
jgi:putative oxygen-independent coproporphyrinogen III oxidase